MEIEVCVFNLAPLEYNTSEAVFEDSDGEFDSYSGLSLLRLSDNEIHRVMRPGLVLLVQITFVTVALIEKRWSAIYSQ